MGNNAPTENRAKRWAEIKNQIRERPLLSYIVGIPIEKYKEYTHGTPQAEFILEAEAAIHLDREAKTERIKNELSKIVGYREAKEYSRKFNISDTTIRQVIEGKKERLSYDVIDKFELWLNKITGFEMSLENLLTPKEYLKSETDVISTELSNISNRILRYPIDIKRDVAKMEIDIYGCDYSIVRALRSDAQQLLDIADRINLYVNEFMKINDK